LTPEPGQVLGDLDRALVGREQVEHERHAAVADDRGARETEEVLHPRREPRALIELVVDLDPAAAGQAEAGRREPIDGRLVLAEGRVEQVEQAGPAQLVERDRALAGARDHAGERRIVGLDEAGVRGA
jgi:hypothetical protein